MNRDYIGAALVVISLASALGVCGIIVYAGGFFALFVVAGLAAGAFTLGAGMADSWKKSWPS